MSDREMRIFDASFRRAQLAYNRFDGSVRVIAGYREAGSYPADWGNRVRDTMAFIRMAKLSLTKAITDAQTAADAEGIRDDELYELSDSESMLNSQLQRVIAVEESLLNTILSGDADYTSMYLASQQVHQDIEARIRRVAYGDSEPIEVPEPVGDVPEEVIDDLDTEEEVIGDSAESEETEEYSDDVEDDSEDDTEDEGTEDDVPEDAEQTEEPGEGSEDEYTDDGDDTQGHHVALVFDDDGTAHIAEGNDAYVMEDPDAVPFVEIDDSDEDATPDADDVMDGWEPAPDESEGTVAADVSELTLEQKAKLVMNDPDIQRFIHDEANRQARAQYQAMVFEAASMTPQETRISTTPQQIPVSAPAKAEPEPEPEPVEAPAPAPEPEPVRKTRTRSTGASSRASKRKDKPAKPAKAEKPEKTGRTFRLRKPKDGE